MKKLLSFILCFVVLFAVVGCSNNSTSADDINSLKDEISKLQDEINALKEGEQSTLPDFADCEIGYVLEVYPKVSFDYKVSEDCIVHIESITATLTAKNVINEGDILDKPFNLFEVTYKIIGNVNTSFLETEKNLYLTLRVGWNQPDFKCMPNGDGSFETIYNSWLSQNDIVYFLRART